MIETRHVKQTEISLLHTLIKELGDYLGDTIEMDEAALEKAIFFDHSCHSFIIFDDQKPCGYALYYYTFSTMTGKKGIYLLDLYVRESARGLGLGKKLFAALAALAKQEDCCRIDWDCLKWNQGSIDMYRAIGAKMRDDHEFFRLELPQIDALLK